MKLTKLDSVLTQLRDAHTVTVEDFDGEHELSMVFSGIFGEDDHEAIYLRYENDDGEEYVFTITEGGLKGAKIKNDTFLIKDDLGETLTLRMYPKPITIAPKQDWD